MLDDGQFEVMLIRKPKNPIAMQHIISSVLNIDEDIDPEYVMYFRTNKLRFISDEEIPWTLDGEYGGSSCCTEVETMRRAVQFCVGENAPYNDENLALSYEELSQLTGKTQPQESDASED